MPPKPKWSDTDEKGHVWIYNYVKSLPGYGTARKEDFVYKFSKNLWENALDAREIENMKPRKYSWRFSRKQTPPRLRQG